MNEEMKETVIKAAEYSNDQKEKMVKVTLVYFILGIISLLYINPDKKVTDTWLTLNRLQLPLGETKYGYIRSICYSGENVKASNSIYRSSLEEKMFKLGLVLLQCSFLTYLQLFGSVLLKA